MRRAGRFLLDERSRGPESRAESGCRAGLLPPPAAQGCCARRPAPSSSAGLVSVRVAVSVPARSALPLRPSQETTFNPPGGSRGSPRAGSATTGAEERGGRSGPSAPPASQLGEEHAALSSPAASPRDCGHDVTPPPPGREAARRVGCGERGRTGV